MSIDTLPPETESSRWGDGLSGFVGGAGYRLDRAATSDLQRRKAGALPDSLAG